MIVDLVRNDLGRVALLGTVQVTAHADLRSFSRVHHLVSTVTARVSKQTSLRELLSATFPCGSITGTPKIAAMKVIRELEDAPRGVWTGAIGTIGPDRSCHFNVAIRTALLREDEIIFNSGGGVTIDSDPQEEYWETIVKSKVLVEGLIAVTNKKGDT
jgi:anthranilate/para-aminobenzoate synthase component I